MQYVKLGLVYRGDKVLVAENFCSFHFDIRVRQLAMCVAGVANVWQIDCRYGTVSVEDDMTKTEDNRKEYNEEDKEDKKKAKQRQRIYAEKKRYKS